MIKENYVSFEVAKLLREKGFDGWCYGCYKPNNEFGTYVMPRTYGGVEGNYILAPTHQMALKWLREKYHLEVGITVGFPTIKNITKYKYFWCIVKVCDNHLEYPMDDPNSSEFCEEMTDSYEQAIEAAIKYCLTNLIK